MDNSYPRRTYFRATSDFGFKKLFATHGNEPLLIQLLNSVIPGKHITEVTLLDKEHRINADTFAVFDVYCRCDDGERFIVEMQKRSYGQFMNRALAYSALAILDQAYRKWDYDFDRVYFVGILNYVHFPKRTSPFTYVALQSIDDHTVINDNYLQIFVEFPKLAAKGKAVGAEGFLRAVRDIGKTDSRPEEFEGKEFDPLFRAASCRTLDKDELKKYETEMTTEDDTREWLEHELELTRQTALAEGEAKGRAEGEAKGRETLLETARRMLAEGLSKDVVIRCTGLSPEEIAGL